MPSSIANILLCEPDLPARQAAATALGRSCNVSCASSAAEVTARLVADEIPDVIVSDLTDQSLAEMAAWSERAPRAAVIFTYAGQESLVAWALRHGAAGCLP